MANGEWRMGEEPQRTAPLVCGLALQGSDKGAQLPSQSVTATDHFLLCALGAPKADPNGQDQMGFKLLEGALSHSKKLNE